MNLGVSELEDLAYLVGSLEDGGLYSLKYKGSRSEYRCVWVQSDLRYLESSVIPRLQRLLKVLGVGAKIQVISKERHSRHEVRVSSKRLYELLRSLREDRSWIFLSPTSVKIAFLRGLYDAEGDKSGHRLRIWNTDKSLLELAKAILHEMGFEDVNLYLDDKRHGVYVLEVSSSVQGEFLRLISPEHPKIARKVLERPYPSSGVT